MNQVAAMPRPDRLRVVWLEDEPLLIELAAFCISECSRKVELVVFENGDAAWRELCRQDPDLFITDCYHPGMPGPEVVRRLADRMAAFPIIWSCGCSQAIHAEDRDRFDLKLAWLPKPWTFEQLSAALEDKLGAYDLA